MKQSIKILSLCFAMTSVISSASAYASNEIQVAIDGEYIEFDIAPQLIDGRTMVPLRAIFEALGAEVDWDHDTQTVIAMKDDVTVTATIGSTKMYIDDEKKTMDIAPMLIGGRTLVPVRFVAEAFGCDVDWIQDEQTVYIESPDIIHDGTLTEEEIYEMYE